MAGYKFRVSKDLEHLLSNLADEKRTTKEEILRRAIAYYALISKQIGESAQPVKVRIEKVDMSLHVEGKRDDIFDFV